MILIVFNFHCLTFTFNLTRNGSVIADYIIELKPGTTESETTITNITKQAVDNIKSNPSPEFDLIQLVDTDKIVVEEIIGKLCMLIRLKI